MADDDRTRRRLSDATKSRIDDLASGWSVDAAKDPPAGPAAPDDADPPRKKQRTIPPPAPGSPERKAFEQTIIAASDDREDATDVLPPKRPTGAQPIVATRPPRDDETNETPPPRIVATRPPRDDETNETPPPRIVATRPPRDDETNETPPPKIVATTRPREDVTEELLDHDPSVVIDAATRSGSPPASARPADPRSTQPGAPPPPPGRGRRFTHPPMVGEPSPIKSGVLPSAGERPRTSTGAQPVAGERPRTSTGAQPIVGARTQGSTGQVALHRDEAAVASPRPRAVTGPQAIIPDIPMRPRTSTGQVPVAPRPRAATGQHAIIPTRSQTQSGQHTIPGARTRTASGQQPSVGESAPRLPGLPPAVGSPARNPFGNAPPPPSRSRRMTGEQPDVASRTHAGTGPHAIVPARTRLSTDSQPIVSKAPTGGTPIVSGRARGATGPQPIVPARNKESTGEQPFVRRSQPLSGPYAAATTSPSGPHGVVQATMEPSGTAPHSGVPSGRGSASVPPPTPLATPRTTSSTRPPPPPGSSERLAAERSKPASAPPPPPSSSERSAFSTQPFGSADRSKPASAPPPTSAERSKPASAPPARSSERSTAFSTLRGSPDRSKPASAPPFDAPSSRKPADRFEDDETHPGPPPEIADESDATSPAVAASPERSTPTSVPPPTAIAVPPLVMSTSALANVPAPEPRTGPHYPRASNDGPTAPFATEGRTFSSEPRTPAVIVDASLEEPRLAPVKQTVPTGEFDSGVQTLEDKTNPRDAAEALLSLPQAETPVEDLLEDDDDEDAEPVDLEEEDDEESGARQRPLHAAPDPSTEKFERGDPTQDAPPDSPEVARGRVKHPTGGTLRASAQLRRKRGRWGDVRYVSTAIFGVRRARKELVELEHRQGLRQTSRRRHLITLGRTAAVMDNFDHPALGKAREQLASIEDERSKHAGAVAASDAELERVRRDRDNNAGKYAIEVSETEAELVELAAKLEPVEKEAVVVRKRAADLREELHRIEKQITDAEASLASPKNEKLDRAAVSADIATYKANKVAVLRDEPIIATELDALNPRIAAMEATRAGLRKKKADLDKAEQEDQRRTVELLEAIGAKRKVVERAAADAEAARDNALFELGERLYVDRSQILTAQLSPIDQIDLEIGEGERRTMELREILSNIDKAKFARGLAIIILAAGALASLAYLVASAVL